jgi:hypothetical protein
MRVETTQLTTLDEDEFRNFWHNALDKLLDGMADHQPSGEKDVCNVCGEYRQLRRNGTTGHLCTRMLSEGTSSVCHACGCFKDAPGHILTKCQGEEVKR